MLTPHMDLCVNSFHHIALRFRPCPIGVSASPLRLHPPDQIASGTRFKLVLFEDDGTVWPADWHGVFRAIEQYHPAVASKVCRHRGALQQLTWDELESQAGSTFAELDARDGLMNEDNYLKAADTPINARRFLAVALSLNKLYAGTGFTADERDPSARGSAEFFAANRLLCSVPNAQVVDLRSVT